MNRALRIAAWLALIAVATAVGATLAVVVLASANPGVKGPNITEDALLAALLLGGTLGAAIPIALWVRRARRAAIARLRG